LNERIRQWFRERGIDTLDLLGILAFSAGIFGRIYTWLGLDDDRGGERAWGGGWSALTGGLLFGVSVVTAATGLLLLFYYHPTPESAQASLRYLENEVLLGRTVRQVHAWSASLLVFLLFVHIIKCFVLAAYRKPGELNWILGSILLFFTFYFTLTGRLLPWDQFAYWRTVANIEVLWNVPIIGSFLVDLLYGGKDVTWITLIRFYSAHIFVLPLVTVGVLLLHFFLLRKYGVVSIPGRRKDDDGTIA
jgi:quinol-cytochrome oxidoreductase complex cytochrome b subunit